jgi:hypothetical protein
MKIAILGWGSLIWDPRDLPREGTWQTGGPILPIEFSRVSTDCRLTLAIDPIHGVPVATRYVQSPRASLDDAIADLCQREGTAKKGVGFMGLGETSCRVEALSPAIRQWGEKHGFEGIVWTDLASNFEAETGVAFSVEEAKSYLVHLPESAADRARKYVNNAPPEVDTPLRRALQQGGWLSPAKPGVPLN